MDRDELDQRAVFTLLGELRSDVKHILDGLNRSHQDIAEVKEEVKERHRELDIRLTKVERFNTRVLTIFALAAPVLIAVVNYGVPMLIASLQ
jgi:hypothetical protein